MVDAIAGLAESHPGKKATSGELRIVRLAGSDSAGLSVGDIFLSEPSAMWSEARDDFTARLAKGDRVALFDPPHIEDGERVRTIEVRLTSSRVSRDELLGQLTDRDLLRMIYWSGATDYAAFAEIARGQLDAIRAPERFSSEYFRFLASEGVQINNLAVPTRLSEVFELSLSGRSVRVYNFCDLMKDDQLAKIAKVVHDITEDSGGALGDHLSQIVIAPKHCLGIFDTSDKPKSSPNFQFTVGRAGGGIICLNGELLTEENTQHEEPVLESPVPMLPKVRVSRFLGRPTKRQISKYEDRIRALVPHVLSGDLEAVLQHEAHHILAQAYPEEYAKFKISVLNAFESGEPPPSQYAVGLYGKIDKSDDYGDEILPEVGVAFRSEGLRHKLGPMTQAAYLDFLREIASNGRISTAITARQLDVDSLRRLHLEAPVQVTVDNPGRFFQQKVSQGEGSSTRGFAAKATALEASIKREAFYKSRVYKLRDGRYLRISFRPGGRSYYSSPEDVTTIEWITSEPDADGNYHSDEEKSFRMARDLNAGDIWLQRVTRAYRGPAYISTASRFGDYPNLIPVVLRSPYQNDYHTYEPVLTKEPITQEEIDEILAVINPPR